MFSFFRANNLADNIYSILKNDISSFSFNTDLRNDPVWGKQACSSCHTDLVRLKEGQVSTQVRNTLHYFCLTAVIISC